MSAAITARQRRDRIALSALLLTLTLLLFGTGASALFTATTSGTTTISSGTLFLQLGADGTSANRLSVDATNIAPGDTINRAVDVVNNGTLDFSSLRLSTTAGPSSLLDTNSTDGLQMAVFGCSTPWNETVVDAGYQYTCSGAQSTHVASRPVIGSDLDLTGIDAMEAGSTAHLLITLVLPESAGNEFQNQTTTVTYTIDGVQRTADNR